MFNHLLLVACICIVVSLILYFFYWNRFIAYVIGQVIRILYWNQEASSIWVEIGSIHFSLLAGRILFKDLRYHSSNQTTKIVKGQIQWRYWIRRPTSEEEINSARGEESKHSGPLRSCRIQLSFQGVEWFLYNRTAAYDNIIAQMEKANQSTSRSSPHGIFGRFTRQESPLPSYPPHVAREPLQTPAFVRMPLTWFRQQLPSLDPKDMLPLGIEIQTGAVILGNASTPNLLVAEFRHALGTYGIVPSRSPHDRYRMVLGLKFHDPQVHFVQNNDYVDPMATLGGVVHGRIQEHAIHRKSYSYQLYRPFIKLWRQMKLYRLTLDYFSTRRSQRLAQQSIKSTTPGRIQTKKVVDEDTPIGIDFSAFEYAVERKILEAPSLELTYYVDAVGEVPTATQLAENDTSDIGNGEADPEWGFHIIVNAGFLRYGPWADRQRAEIQRAFFPPIYQNAELSPKLFPGDKRTWTSLQMFIELRHETTLHIPFREASKDWQWDGLTEIPHRPRKREFASINLVAGDRSSIYYNMPMITGPSGYESTLEIHLDAISLTSSLDDIRLINAESCRIRGELPSPLLWNAERAWLITVCLRQPILYLLRDHINIFIDLGKDWVSGPPANYQTFIPAVYSVKFELHHFEINQYANDQNIVDKPLIKDENALLILRGPHLKISTEIPLNVFNPEFTSIPFSVTGPDMTVDFLLPRWSTHALHAPKQGITLLHTESLDISGSYLYFVEVREENVEQLKLDFEIRNAVFKAFGWSIRYFMVLRDNYLGSFTHFQTLYEYLEKRKHNLPLGDPIWLKYRPGKSNMLQAQLSLHAQRVTVLTPIGLMGHAMWNTAEPQPIHRSVKDCFVYTVPEVQFQFRMHDYYMEMSLNLDVITGSFRNDHPVNFLAHSSNNSIEEVVTINGIDITANRLFGPQPRTLAYVCIWEIVVGNVKASMSASDAKALLAAGNSFRLNFVDLVNSPAAEYLPPADLDVTFYKITVGAVDVSWMAGLAAMIVRLDQGLKFDSNDLGAHHYRRVTSIKIPHISSKVLLTASTERNVWLEAAEVVFDVYLDIYSAPKGHRLTTRAQLAFLEEQDKLTGRAKQMFDQLRHRSRVNSPNKTAHKNDIYLPQPSLPTFMNKINVAHQERQPRARSSPWRMSKQASLSDTDDEAGVSEADRDARLAKTRTSTPVPEAWQDDDMTMSSGDESDNADLTDGSSSGDEWSDIGDSTKIITTGSLLSFYSPLTRHYAANHSGIEATTFTLTREATPFKFHEGDRDNVQTPDPPAFTDLEGISKDAELTSFRIICQHDVLITITPLILSAFTYLEEDIKKIRADPAMCIDFFLQKCIEDISAKVTPKSVAFDVSLPHASIFILQHVAMSDGHPNVYKAMESTNIPSNLDMTAVANFRISGAHVVGCLTPESNILKASIDQSVVALDTSIDKRTLSSAPPGSIIFQFILSSLTIHLSRRSLSVTLAEFLIQIGHRGPELITTTLIALVSAGTQVARSVQGLKTHDAMTKRAIVRTILMASGDKPVIDPLSTIQPSYLVQTGTPHSLRTELKFKFFYHLRDCIWGLKDQGNVFWHTVDLETISADDLMSLVEERLTLLDQDACNEDHLTSLEALFFTPSFHSATTSVKSGSALLDSFSLCVTKSTFVALDPTGGPSSEAHFNDVVFKIYIKLFELVQSSPKDPTSASQTSLRAKPSRIVQKIMVIISSSEATLIILPHLLHFTQYILRVKRQCSSGLQDKSPPQIVQDVLERPSNHSGKFSHVKIMMFIHHLRAQAAAENLVLVVGMRGLQLSSSLLTSQVQSYPSMNHSVLFQELYLQARSPADPAKESNLDILAGLTFTNGRTSLVSRSEPLLKANLKLTFILADLRLHVPRSALRLYRFVEEWRADYLPGMEAAMNTLLSEYNGKPTKSPSPTPSSQSRPSPIIQFHAQINHLESVLQVMHGTWLSWECKNIVTYFHASNTLIAGSKYTFGLQISSMILNVSANANSQDPFPDPRVKLVLPELSIAGRSDGHNVHTLVLFEAIELKVKPSHWDTLLAVQQKFGQDFNDLVALMQKNRREKSPTEQPRVKKQMSLKYGGYVKMRGFCIGLEGLSSTVYLECPDINGGIGNTKEWAWEIGLSDLALSLAPRGNRRQSTTFNRNHGSAFVIIDFNISAVNKEPLFEKNLQISISKIHAVMQPSSMGEVGDFIDNLQVEMLARQEQRSLELAAFKERTQSILRTFDVSAGDVELEQSSWINDCIITISIQGVGVAFPLSHDDDLEPPCTKNKSQDSFAVGAFLLSIKSIEFGAHRGETGKALMQRLSFQFVSRFRQSVPEDFIADRHQTHNRLLYPEMKAQLRSSSTGTARKIWVGANVSGFILDLDSTIPNYVFALIDVYRQGKERVERLSTNVPRTPTPTAAKPSLEKHYTAIPTSNIFVNLTFLSGKVRLYSGTASKSKFLALNPLAELSDEQVLGLGAEVFNLPMVSVWAEYRATPASQKRIQAADHPSILMFKSTVHSSQNTLRPTLLPFLNELINHVEIRMRKASSRARPVALTPLSSSIPLPPKEEKMEFASSMQICFSLRIDRSKLELTCQPDVNVVAGLYWESGGFIVNISPGARNPSFSGSISGLTVGLKHGFLSEDCVKLDARNLGFSVNCTKTETDTGNVVSSISVVLDTELRGGVRFSRFQDVLCFMAVWLDRIPIFNNHSPTQTTNALQPTTPIDDQVGGLSTVILLRIRRIKLNVDLGQSISTIDLELQQTVFRTKLTGEFNEFFIFVGDLSVMAYGNLSGRARVPSCVFQTIRRSEGGLFDHSGRSRMLELRFTSGALAAVLESDRQQLLHYCTGPLEVEIFDDWSMTHTDVDGESRPLRLSFTIASSEVVAAVTVGTVPKLLSYINKFKANLDAQRQGAFRESQTFRVTRNPKLENALSAVAEAMIYSARNRLREADAGLSYMIRQHMSFRLDLLQLIVFPRTMEDVEIAQFIGRDVRARLDRSVDFESSPTKRDLRLSFASMTISKYTQVGHPISHSESEFPDVREWVVALFKNATEAIIVGLPSMTMSMVSEETIEELVSNLVYDFHSEFIRREGMKAFEDIYITLNMSLYSWLTVLRKNLTREMDQVRSAEVWRTSMGNTSATTAASGSLRTKVPEPFSLVESPRPSDVPSGSAFHLSTSGPSSARVGWLEQGRSPTAAREILSPVSPISMPASPIPSGKVITEPPTTQGLSKKPELIYHPRTRHIERLTMRQLGEATPDVMHPFFMKKAGFNLEDSLPQYLNEYATGPLEEIMEFLLKVYSRQLIKGSQKSDDSNH